MSGAVKGRGLLKATSLLWVGLAAVLVAYFLVWLLGSGGAGNPPPVDIDRHLDSHLVERAEAFRSDARLLSIASMLVGLILLGFLALYRGPLVRRPFDRLARRPVPGAALAGATISVLLVLARFPIDLMSFNLGRDYGLVTQDHAGWLTDLLIGTLITALLAALGAALAMWLWRKLKGRFWIAGSALVITYMVLFVWLWPVIVSPLFNSFRTLPEGSVRQEVIRLADQAGVGVGQVYVVDASRRSSTLNAYVNGIGSSKRVVIYDNAINELSKPELSALLAHELSHVSNHDLYRGLAFAILIVPLGALFVQLSTTALVRRREGEHDDLGTPMVIPTLALTIALVTMVLSVPGNVLSREIEDRADRSAVELTGNPTGLVDLQVRLARSNLADPDPPSFYQYLFGTHPTTLERIAEAEAVNSRKPR
jgi:STE24 endopeptidase